MGFPVKERVGVFLGLAVRNTKHSARCVLSYLSSPFQSFVVVVCRCVPVRFGPNPIKSHIDPGDTC